jgi:xanthine/CO dehydrogenase XdhC/CoxF family maturation factor/MOSC domain-containing protein YiiM
MGTIKAICISEKRGTKKVEIDEAVLIENFGIEGDAHAGNWHRQVSLLSYEKTQEFKAKGADITYGDFGENLVVEGFDFKTLPIGTRFSCGEVLLEMTQIGKECHSHCEIYKRMGDCIMPREGVFAIVLRGGSIKKGDELTLIPDNLYSTIRDRNPDEQVTLATVLEGEHVGEKTLWMNGIMRWESCKYSFPKRYKDEILSKDNCTIIKPDDSRIFCEKIGSRKDLVICGAGHVSLSIIEFAKKIGFFVTVIDDRPYFADNARRVGADVCICDNFVNALNNIEGGSNTYFVIVTRGHRYDLDCIRTILNKKSAYVGMMGSKRRVSLLKKGLIEEGFNNELVDSVHAPIGLSIGAQTPDEIAISIIAELIEIKNKTQKVSTYDDELLSYLAGDISYNKADNTSKCGILCTIVDKKGSTPRECGTKMLILPDNKIIGTIGGGCVESKVIEIGRLMLSEDATSSTPRLELLDMTAENDLESEEAMVCGGTVLIYMERTPIKI